MSNQPVPLHPGIGRSPHGERGLKSPPVAKVLPLAPSLPSRGAWIEICIRWKLLLSGRSSLPSRGAWIEIPCRRRGGIWAGRRSPHGERGLKLSLWMLFGLLAMRRSPHGERGLKSYLDGSGDAAQRRSPHGERGLKCAKLLTVMSRLTVAPLTGSVD